MSSSLQDIEAWASAYIALLTDGTRSNEKHPLWWAAEKFMPLPDESSIEECWSGILAVLARNPPESVIGMLAAGPLEHLIHYSGPRFIDRIELEARGNPAFRHLLGGVWESSTSDVWARVEAVRGPAW